VARPLGTPKMTAMTVREPRKVVSTHPGERQGSFKHDAIFYAGLDDFVAQTSAFIRDGVRAQEPILVVVDAAKIDRLRTELGEDAEAVRFADMAGVGANPARIIPAWQEFIDENADSGLPFRGIGEPISAARTPDELVECERHEALLNLAFADSPPWWLACPYDVLSLGRSVLAEAKRNHPGLIDGETLRTSDTFRGLPEVAKPFDAPLPAPPADAEARAFDEASIPSTRRWVADMAALHGVHPPRVADLVLAVSELASNSVRYGDRGGTLSMWSTDTSFICEVRDAGVIRDPLAGRNQPTGTQTSGFGLWIVTQLCDLVQIRTDPTGTVVRVHMYR
jgi:anti-sigma regulatory factor (Ser/Thr protein kinase)